MESYWTAQTSAGTVVMLADASIDDWPEKYRRECLGDRSAEPLEVPPPVRGLRVSSQTPDGAAVAVDHFLLRLPRGH